MSMGVGIACFNTLRQSEQNRLGIFQLVCELLQLEQRANAGQQLGEIDRLAEKIVRAGINSVDAVFGLRKPRDKHYRSEPGFGSILDSAANLEAVHSRHHDIEQYQIRPKRGALRQRGLAVVHFVHLKSFAAQQHFERVAGGRFVINDQDFRIHRERTNVSCRLVADNPGILKQNRGRHRRLVKIARRAK